MLTEIKDVFIILLGCASIYYVYKNRRNSLREDLYKRQVELAISIIKTIEPVFDNLIILHRNRSNIEFNQEEAYSTITERLEEFMDQLEIASLLFPDDLYFSSSELLKKLVNYKKAIWEGNQVFDERKLLELEVDYVDRIRGFLGVEPLSKETQNLIKTSRTSWIEAIRK